MKVQNHLADLRQKRGLAAAELASQIGVTRQNVYAMATVWTQLPHNHLHRCSHAPGKA
jgi:DNA-binding Xre family transcriptional regulator